MQAEILDWLSRHDGAMRQLLQQLVDTDSGSRHVAGIDRVAGLIRQSLEASGIEVQTIPCPGYGSCLRAELAPGGPAPVLLMGHMDTVFPAGTAAARPYRVEGNLAYGPGVADMKSGLVMNTFIAKAFAEVIGVGRVPLRLFYSCDEEIASPASREWILAASEGAAAVFNAEPGRPNGNVVTGRKGAFFIDFEVSGVAAHAGGNHAAGASAIGALAAKTLALHALTDYDSGITTNVGTVRGGSTVNTVADSAFAQVDVRFTADTDADALYRTIDSIVKEESVRYTCGHISHVGRFLAMADSGASQKMLDIYRSSARQLGFDVKGEFSGGCADSGLTASRGVPTLCGTGPVGAHPHTVKEYCDISTLVPRAQAVALSVLALHPALASATRDGGLAVQP
ncbi:M20 family metallopeptidase [Xylophilus rhododendri]|nr:M20 family metallopeptidase [Xylophilus rhododendri]